MSTLKSKLVQRLEQIAGITHQDWPDRDDGFSTLSLNGKEIAHFHNDNEIDLRLGKGLIKSEGLTHYPDSTKHPKRSANSQFIEVRFKNQADLDRIIRLVKLLVNAT